MPSRHDDDDGDAGVVERRLARLLEQPSLAEVVPRLAPEALHRLVRHCGLHACAPVLAAAAPPQIAALADLDLWRSDPSHDDRFDERRFGEWLDVLADEGPDVAARVLAAMDRDLAITGLAAHVRVCDPGVVSDPSSDGAGAFAEAAALGHEIGGYLVWPRSTSTSWDAILAALVAWTDLDADGFHSAMRGCRRLTNSIPETDELDDLLLAADQQRHDLAAARDARRTGRGYVSPADARSFLHLAARAEDPSAAAGMHAIVAAYVRGLDDLAAAPDNGGAPRGGPGTTRTTAADERLVHAFDGTDGDTRSLSSSPASPRALPGASPATASTPMVPIEPLMLRLDAMDRPAWFARQRELAFLANVLAAGSGLPDRAFTPAEARRAAIGVCNLGLECALGAVDFIGAFTIGWRLLREDVTTFAARRLHAVIDRLRSGDLDVQRDLLSLRRQLARGLDAKTPWAARDALDVIAMLDAPVWTCLRALIAECPVLPAALPAILAQDARPVSPSDFEAFSTRAQVRVVRDFAVRIEPLLLRG